MRRLTGLDAIAAAEHGATAALHRHADANEGERSGLSLAEAREIAATDPALVWCWVEVQHGAGDAADGDTTYEGVDVGPLVALDSLADLMRAVVDAADKLDPAVYLPYSQDWHRPRQHAEDNGTRLCAVCDAGAVLAALGFAPDYHFVFPPHQIGVGYQVARRIAAIDSMRSGRYSTALMQLGHIPDAATTAAIDRVPAPVSPTWHYTSGDHKRIWKAFRTHIDDIRRRVIPALVKAGL